MPSKTSNVSETWSYEASVARIETLIQQLEAGDLPLADVFTQFEKAVTTLNQCETYLEEKQKQVDLLIETLE